MLGDVLMAWMKEEVQRGGGRASVFAGTKITAEARAGKFPKYLEIKIIKRKPNIWRA